MTVEQVHVVDFHAFQALVQARHQIFAAAPVAVRSRPHVVAGLARDEELVAIRSEILVHQSAHGLLGRAIHRSVIVSQVEVGNAMVESIMRNLATALVGVHTTEVVPESQTHLRQQHTRAPAALKLHPIIVAVLIRKVIFLHR